MRKLIYAVFAALTLSLAVTAYSDNISNDLETSLIRLHIIANSDSYADQAVKLMVRDAVLKEFDSSADPEAAAVSAEGTAQRVLKEEGFDYGAKGVFVTMNFPTKRYGSLTLPAGRYRAVRVILGNGEGHNWWCVLYPPVCMADDEQARKLLKNSLNDDTYELVAGGDKPAIKFKTVEIAEKFIDMLREKH